MTKSYAAELRKRISLFQHYTETKKQVFLTLITTFGLVKNEHSLSLLDNEINLDRLFEE